MKQTPTFTDFYLFKYISNIFNTPINDPFSKESLMFDENELKEIFKVYLQSFLEENKSICSNCLKCLNKNQEKFFNFKSENYIKKTKELFNEMKNFRNNFLTIIEKLISKDIKRKHKDDIHLELLQEKLEKTTKDLENLKKNFIFFVIILSLFKYIYKFQTLFPETKSLLKLENEEELRSKAINNKLEPNTHDHILNGLNEIYKSIISIDNIPKNQKNLHSLTPNLKITKKKENNFKELIKNKPLSAKNQDHKKINFSDKKNIKTQEQKKLLRKNSEKVGEISEIPFLTERSECQTPQKLLRELANLKLISGEKLNSKEDFFNKIETEENLKEKVNLLKEKFKKDYNLDIDLIEKETKNVNNMQTPNFGKNAIKKFKKEEIVHQNKIENNDEKNILVDGNKFEFVTKVYEPVLKQKTKNK